MHNTDTINPSQFLTRQTGDTYIWSREDVKYFSFTVQDPNNSNLGKRGLFLLRNGSGDPYLSYSANYSTENGRITKR